MRPLSPLTPLTPLRFLTACLAAVEDQSGAEEAVRDAIDQGHVDWRRVIWLASAHLVTPSLTAGLERLGGCERLPEDVAGYLDAFRQLNRERNAIFRPELGRIAARLNHLGLEPLLLKGANALLPDAYPGAGDRMLGDLDLWIPEVAHPVATAALQELGYRVAEESWQFMLLRDRQTHHHGTPLLHVTKPVKVELHRQLVKYPADDERLVRHLIMQRVALAPGVTVQVPDILSRLRHNFLHAQINDRQARLRQLNLRQLLEFARLAELLDPGEHETLLAGLRPRHHRRFLEYWALAEHWLGLPYPECLSLSPLQHRELWLTERAAESRAWALGFRFYDGALRLPSRVWNLGVRLVHMPEYFPAKARALWHRKAATEWMR